MGQKVTREQGDHSEEQSGSMAWGSTNRYGNVKILHEEARELDGLKRDNHYYSTGQVEQQYEHRQKRPRSNLMLEWGREW